MEFLSENLRGRVSPDKTQFNQGRLIFFDDVVHAIAFSPCGKLLAVEAKPTVFLGPRFSESDVELRHKRAQGHFLVKVPTVFLVQDFQKATLLVVLQPAPRTP